MWSIRKCFCHSQRPKDENTASRLTAAGAGSLSNCAARRWESMFYEVSVMRGLLLSKPMLLSSSN